MYNIERAVGRDLGRESLSHRWPSLPGGLRQVSIPWSALLNGFRPWIATILFHRSQYDEYETSCNCWNIQHGENTLNLRLQTATFSFPVVQDLDRLPCVSSPSLLHPQEALLTISTGLSYSALHRISIEEMREGKRAVCGNYRRAAQILVASGGNRLQRHCPITPGWLGLKKVTVESWGCLCC